MTIFASAHRGAFCKFPFRWIYYYGSNKSTGKETGKTHLCAAGQAILTFVWQFYDGIGSKQNNIKVSLTSSMLTDYNFPIANFLLLFMNSPKSNILQWVINGVKILTKILKQWNYLTINAHCKTYTLIFFKYVPIFSPYYIIKTTSTNLFLHEISSM